MGESDEWELDVQDIEIERRYQYQVAGHDRLACGRLIRRGSILECVIKPTSLKELQFYRDAYTFTRQFAQRWMPRFHGYFPSAERTDPLLNDDTDLDIVPVSLVLEDLTRGFGRPCVCDIKLGKRLYDHEASDAKRTKMTQLAETTASGVFGVRITGMMYHHRHTETVVVGKQACRAAKTRSQIRDLLCDFLRGASSTVSSNGLRQRVCAQLDELTQSFPRELRLVSSSLLIVYDETDTSRLILRLIDFARSRICHIPADHLDDFAYGNAEVLDGLRALRQLVIEDD